MSATSAGLFYNFSDTTPGTYFGLGNPGAGNLVCFGVAGGCGSTAPTGVLIGVNNQAAMEALSGSTQIGTPLAAPAATPELSGLVLLGTGAVGLAGAMRRRLVC